jgi:hypothetical protein
MKRGHYENITNQVFYNLTAKTFIEITYKQKRPFVWWNCVCKCGNKVIASSRDLKRGHKKSCGCKRKDPRPYLRKPNATFFNLYQAYGKAAKARNIPFKISFQHALALFQLPCFYCKQLPAQLRKGRSVDNKTDKLYNGIDRVNSSKGYIKGNVVAACMSCNYAKRAKTLEAFVEWIDRISLHSKTWRNKL